MPRAAQASEVAIERLFASLVTALLFGILSFVGYQERAYQRMGRGVDADLAALRGMRWEPPALRGAAGDGNAANEIFAAIDNWRPLPKALRDGLAEKIFSGQPLSGSEGAALTERDASLRALRAAAFQRWAQTDLAPELGDAMRVPRYARVIEAGMGLLANAEAANPDECLQRSAEVIRIGQSLVPAAPLEAASVATHLTALAARVIPRCARNAELTSLRRSAHELRMLATHAPAIGSSIEFEEIVAAMEFRNKAALSNKPSPSEVVRTILHRPQLLAAWSTHERAIRFRQIAAEHYPDAMEEWKREQDFRLQSATASGGKATEHILGRVHDDMRGQALLRMLAIGLNTLADRTYRGTLPAQPPGLRDPALADPFRGQPLSYYASSNGLEISFWSVGEDFRDDLGSEDWSDAAPRDITVRFPLGPRPAQPTATRKRP